jgi:predicted TPR repeat methyltransferase
LYIGILESLVFYLAWDLLTSGVWIFSQTSL